MKEIRIKRVYDAAGPDDGKRILVDRIWPRGISRERARLDEWMMELAPSDALRKWFHADGDWDGFLERYFAELDGRRHEVAALRETAARQVVTLVYARADETRNNAVALKLYLQSDRPASR